MHKLASIHSCTTMNKAKKKEKNEPNKYTFSIERQLDFKVNFEAMFFPF